METDISVCVCVSCTHLTQTANIKITGQNALAHQVIFPASSGCCNSSEVVQERRKGESKGEERSRSSRRHSSASLQLLPEARVPDPRVGGGTRLAGFHEARS